MSPGADNGAVEGGGRPGLVEDLDADLERTPFSGAPDPEFTLLSARAVERAAVPTLGFTVRAADASGRRIFTIALNLKREWFRSRKRRPEAPLDETATNVPASYGAEGRVMATRALSGPLNGLPGDQREVIARHWFAGMTFPEVAKVVGATTGAVKLRAHRGYVALRDALGVERIPAGGAPRNPEPSSGIQPSSETMSIARGLR